MWEKIVNSVTATTIQSVSEKLLDVHVNYLQSLTKEGPEKGATQDNSDMPKSGERDC